MAKIDEAIEALHRKMLAARNSGRVSAAETKKQLIQLDAIRHTRLAELDSGRPSRRPSPSKNRDQLLEVSSVNYKYPDTDVSENPYLALFLKLKLDRPETYVTEERFGDPGLVARRSLALHYAWAVPNDEAIDMLVEYSPLVEIGAGHGYWAALARSRGANVVALDYQNFEFAPSLLWGKVEVGKPEDLGSHSRRTLFMCWPPEVTSMARSCLDYWEGDDLIYVGDQNGVVTGGSRFISKLHKDFDFVKEVAIPCVPAVGDTMTVWRRK